MSRNDESVAVVTGGGRGIDQGVAHALAERGATVYIAGRSQAGGIHTSRFVSERSGGEGRPQLMVVLELERGATWGGDLECSICQRLMQVHSDEEMTRCHQALPPGATLYRFRTS